jgi:hypothetical protein
MHVGQCQVQLNEPVRSYGVVRSKFFTETEIGENDVSVAVQKNILEFNVSIDDAQLENTHDKPCVCRPCQQTHEQTLCNCPRANASSAM